MKISQILALIPKSKELGLFSIWQGGCSKVSDPFHIFRCASISCTDHCDGLTHQRQRSAISHVCPFSPMGMICLFRFFHPVQSGAKLCKVMQFAKLCDLQSYARCKVMQPAKLCNVNSSAVCTIMQCAKVCNVRKKATCKSIHCVKLCNLQYFAKCQTVGNYAMGKIMQWAKLCNGKNHAICKYMQCVKLCQITNYSMCISCKEQNCSECKIKQSASII